MSAKDENAVPSAAWPGDRRSAIEGMFKACFATLELQGRPIKFCPDIPTAATLVYRDAFAEAYKRAFDEVYDRLYHRALMAASAAARVEAHRASDAKRISDAAHAAARHVESHYPTQQAELGALRTCYDTRYGSVFDPAQEKQVVKQVVKQIEVMKDAILIDESEIPF